MSNLSDCALTISGVEPANTSMTMENDYPEFVQHMADNGGFKCAIIQYDPVGAIDAGGEKGNNVINLGWDKTQWYFAGGNYTINILFHNEVPVTVFGGEPGQAFVVLVYV